MMWITGPSSEVQSTSAKRWQWDYFSLTVIFNGHWESPKFSSNTIQLHWFSSWFIRFGTNVDYRKRRTGRRWKSRWDCTPSNVNRAVQNRRCEHLCLFFYFTLSRICGHQQVNRCCGEFCSRHTFQLKISFRHRLFRPLLIQSDVPRKFSTIDTIAVGQCASNSLHTRIKFHCDYFSTVFSLRFSQFFSFAAFSSLLKIHWIYSK